MSQIVSAPSVILHPVTITLDKPRRLIVDMNALVLIEEQTGVSFIDMRKKEWKPDIKSIRVMLWAALVYDDPDLTLEQVGAMVSLPRLQEVMQAVAEAWRTQVGENKADEKSGAGPLAQKP